MISNKIFQLSRKSIRDFSKLNRFQSRKMSSSHTPALKEPHFNDVPVPHEPFEVGYSRRQRGNNFVLAAGIVFFSATVTFVYNSGVIIPNLTPPKKNLGEF